MSNPALVQFKGVQKTYDGLSLVVRNLDLDIRRGEFLSLRSREFVQAAITCGQSNATIIFRQILPNCLSPIFVFTTLRFGQVILLGAALSWRFPRLRWLHFAALVWAAFIEFSGGICPLTPLENRLRRLAGGSKPRQAPPQGWNSRRGPAFSMTTRPAALQPKAPATKPGGST